MLVSVMKGYFLMLFSVKCCDILKRTERNGTKSKDAEKGRTMRKNKLLYDKETPFSRWSPDEEDVWNQASPIGNGAMGAMVFGGAAEEKLQINEDTVWYGCGGRNRVNPKAAESYKGIRTLLMEGKVKEAQEKIAACMFAAPDQQRTYDTAGDLFFRFHPEGTTTVDYRRTLELNKALVELVYTAQAPGGNAEGLAGGPATGGNGGLSCVSGFGRRFRREYFSSAAHQVIAVHQETQDGTLPDISMDMAFMRTNVEEIFRIGQEYLCMTVKEGGNGCRYCVMATAVHTGGTLEFFRDQLLIKGASEATIYLTIRTDFYGDDILKWAQAKLEAVRKLPYEKVREAHIKEYRKYFDRMDLELDRRPFPEKKDAESTGNTDKELTGSAGIAEKELTVPEALERLKRGEEVPGFAENYFQFGRYLLISCSRPGSQPANLQGIWNRSDHPAWGSKYTININTEMNYWPAESCNLSECHRPLFDLLRRMLPNGRQVAGEMYGLPGFTAHHNTDLFGDCAPQDLWMPATIWPMGAAWLCTHIWRHYEYTLDDDFLEETMDLLREACLFLSEYLFENEDGLLVTGPSVSPENTYIHSGGQSGQACVGPTMDTEIIRELYHACLEGARITGCEDALTDKLREQLTRLPQLRTGKYGQIMEWAQDYDEAEPGHRHISHLYALYPAQQISYEKTPELMDAARLTLERRLSHGGGHTGWSRAWIINMWARLRDGEKAYGNLRALWTNSTYLNLFDRHPPFQIDGNFGGIAGVAEMLLQDDREGRLWLLPALPKAWSSGKLRGLRARGAKEIDMEWEDGVPVRADIRAEKGGSFTLMLPVERYDVSSGADVEIRKKEEGFFCRGEGAYEVRVLRK